MKTALSLFPATGCDRFPGFAIPQTSQTKIAALPRFQFYRLRSGQPSIIKYSPYKHPQSIRSNQSIGNLPARIRCRLAALATPEPRQCLGDDPVHRFAFSERTIHRLAGVNKLPDLLQGGQPFSPFVSPKTQSSFNDAMKPPAADSFVIGRFYVVRFERNYIILAHRRRTCLVWL